MTKISIKTGEQIKIMAEGGAKLAMIRDQLAMAVKPGVTPLQLDQLADNLISKEGGKPSFKLVSGYNNATCICVNEVVVHGIPTGKDKFKEGDIVGIDVGMIYKGWHTDTATTVRVEELESRRAGEKERFLETGRRALKLAIDQVKIGKRVADISEIIQKTVEKEGYSAVRALTGHGVGKELHEEPAIPCFKIGEYEYSPKLTEGMVLAIEVMYNAGTAEVVYKDSDGWTIITADGKISGLFEETVAITKNGPQVLTQRRK